VVGFVIGGGNDGQFFDWSVGHELDHSLDHRGGLQERFRAVFATTSQPCGGPGKSDHQAHKRVGLKRVFDLPGSGPNRSRPPSRLYGPGPRRRGTSGLLGRSQGRNNFTASNPRSFVKWRSAELASAFRPS
jgi:hypothetical protein